MMQKKQRLQVFTTKRCKKIFFREETSSLDPIKNTISINVFQYIYRYLYNVIESSNSHKESRDHRKFIIANLDK